MRTRTDDVELLENCLRDAASVLTHYNEQIAPEHGAEYKLDPQEHVVEVAFHFARSRQIEQTVSQASGGI